MPDVLQQVRDSIADRTCAALSLDVFDTILWRRVPRPSDAFVLLAESLRRAGLCPAWVTDASFRHMRIEAERTARAGAYGPEVSLFDIWRAMPLDLFDASLESLVAAEVDLERSLTVVDSNIAELIELACEHQLPVFMVSDTYFSEDQLRHLLDRPELVHLRESRLFRSLEFRTGKGDGLWPVVLEEVGLRPEQFWHVGDNLDADVRAPGAYGIRCLYYERIDAKLGQVLERELSPQDLYGPMDSLLDPVEGDFGLTSLRAKAVRRVPKGLAQAVTTAWIHGAGVLGPVLTGYAEWVADKAVETGTNVLWCPMREGQLLSQLVNEAARERGLKVEARPLWLSRHVTSVAMLDQVNRETLSDLMRRSHQLTVGQLLHTLNLRPGDVPALAGESDTVLGDRELLERVASALTESPQLLNQMTATVTAARARLITALNKAGALEEASLTLVDLGWGATIQYQLAQVLKLARIPVIPSGLYLATEDRAARVYLAGLRAEGYLAQAGSPREVAATLTRSPEVLEQCVNALCGSLIDFTDDGEPVLGSVVDGPAQTAERRAVQDGVLAFQGLWNSYVATADHWPRLSTPAAAKRLANIMTAALQAPTADEARVFGNWQHEDNFGSDVVTSVIPEDLAGAIAYLSPNDLDDLAFRDAFWPRLVAATDPSLARQIEALHAGHVDSNVFEPSGELFESRARWRSGDGQLHRGPSCRVRINHNGLSFARLNVAGEDIESVALAIPGRPAIVRIDWIEARMIVGRGEPVILRWDNAEEVASLVFSRCRWLGGTLVEFDSQDSSVWLPLADRVGRRVSAARISVGFAMLPRSLSGLEPHMPSAPTALRLAHRAAAEYRRDGVVGLATGLRHVVTRRLAPEQRTARRRQS